MAVNISGNLAYKHFERQKINKQYAEISRKSLPAAEKFFYLMSVIFIVALASIVISGYAQIAELNYEAQKLEKSIISSSDEIDNLERKIAELSSPERIIKIAQEKLGMVMDESQVIVLNKKH